ncbi:MAG TPA: XRE family transcriptional regulator, partial [Polyangiaceae bacterium]|nr:XRE family transcriptional regulator [Polyangiaceae bacterium]
PTVTSNSGDDMGAARVARRVSDGLRRFRKARGLSLDELAQRSGVSRAALSQIEGARTNPTLAVLWKVAVGLEVPFQVLMGVTEELGPRILRAGETPPLRSADGRMESRLLSPGGSAPDLEVYELTFLPKAAHRSEPHGQGTNETLIVLTGALRVSISEETYELAAGDTLFFHADVPHVYENRSSHESRCIDVIRYVRAN